MKLTTVKIRPADLKRINKRKLVDSESRWETIKRLLDLTEKKKVMDDGSENKKKKPLRP